MALLCRINYPLWAESWVCIKVIKYTIELSIRFLTSDIIGTIGDCGLRNVPHINKTWNYVALLFTIFSCTIICAFLLIFLHTNTLLVCRHFEYTRIFLLHFFLWKYSLRMKMRGMKRRISLIMQKFQFHYDFYSSWIIAFVKRGKVLFSI